MVISEREMNCPTHLLYDLPADTDEFGAHEQLAEAIARMIDGEPGGRTIGIQGAWGSGKSTVISLLKKRLDQEVAAVEFNAWAHRGDPLRRVFIERTIRELQQRDWIEGKKWDDEIAKLDGRQKTETTKSESHFTVEAYLVAGALLLVPIGTALLGDAVRGEQFAPFGAQWLKAAFGMLLILAPLFVALFALAKAPAEHRYAPLSVLTKQGPSITTSETSQDPNPTSLEFERVFQKLMGELLVGEDSERRKVVLILDNLDRVSSEEALSIWSTLQIFMGREGGRPEWLRRIWVIVPFDQRWLRNLLDGEDAESFAESFLEKALQIRFALPAPVLSAWKSYLAKAFAEVLPAHRHDAHHVVTLFGLYCAERRIQPTPREVKRYVNDIGVLHHIRGHDFSVLAYAHASLLARHPGVPDFGQALLGGDLPLEDFVRSVDGLTRDALAAIHYGVGVDEARHLLFEPKIRELLWAGDGTHLRQLTDGNPDGFWAVFPQAAAGNVFDWSQLDHMMASARCLVDSGVLDDEAFSDQSATVKRSFGRLASQISSVEPLDETMAFNVVQACRVVGPDPEWQAAVLRMINATRIEPRQEVEEDDPTGAARWLRASLIVLDALGGQGFSPAPGCLLVPATGAEGWIRACDELVSHKALEDTWRAFRATPTPEQIVETLSQRAEEDEFGQAELYTVMVARAAMQSSFGSLTRPIARRLKGELNASESKWLVLGLRELERLDAATTEAIDELVDSGRTVAHYGMLRGSGEMEGAALCAYWTLVRHPLNWADSTSDDTRNGSLRLKEDLKSEGPGDIVPAFVKLLSGEAGSELILRIASENSDAAGFASSCLRLLIDSGHGVSLTGDQLLVHWRFVRSSLDGGDPDLRRFNQLVRNADEGFAPSEKLVASGFSSQLSGLYIPLITEDDPSQELIRICQEGIAAASRGEWDAELSGEGQLLDLLIELSWLGWKPSLGRSFRDAVLAHAQRVAEGESAPLRLGDKWETIKEAMGPDGLAIFRRELYEQAKRRDGKFSPAFFDLYGVDLSDVRLLTEDRNCVIGFFIPLAKVRNAAGLKWLVELVQGQPGLMNSFPEDTVREFADLLAEQAEQPDEDDATQWLARLGELLKPA